ncbi:MAG: VCBS repeat-containing protein [Verrucomicrobiota bacterium]
MRSLLHWFLILNAWFLVACGKSRKSSSSGSASIPEQNSSIPLAARTAASGEKQFTRIPGEASGIDLVHLFPDGAPFELMIDQYSGSGVAVGDIDNDGLPDLYLTNYDQGNRLYRNLGDWRFADVTEAAGVGGMQRWGAGTTFADIDNDGDLDLYVCVFNAPNLLYINDGTGAFIESASTFGLDHTGASVMMSFADYDNDGDLDGYLVTHRSPLQGRHRLPKSSKEAFDRGILRIDSSSGQRQAVVTDAYRDLFKLVSRRGGRTQLITAGERDLLFRNEGGTFVNVSDSAGISGHWIGLAATWWDADRDGDPDLYVSNDYKGPDQFFRNNGDGTFTDRTRETFPHTPWLSMGTDFADINNDGDFDFVATDMAGTNHYKQKMGMGNMTKDRWFLEEADPQQYMRNAVYLNSGTERFMEVAFLTGLANSDWTWSAKFGDFDNDGWSDLFFTNGMSRDFMNSDLGKKFKGVRNEKWKDLPILKQPNLVFRNQGAEALAFESKGTDWGLDQVAASYGAALADLDRDGDLDLIHTNFDEAVRWPT